MNVGVSILFLESCQRISPEDEQSAGESASDSFDNRAGVGFATTKRCDIGKCNVAARGEEEILAEAGASLLLFRPCR